MKQVNWDEVKEETARPVPGGYIAQIVSVEDNEEKEYLRICWEFFEGEFKGSNQDTYDTHGFWPMQMICSYKKKALPFFKGFKTAVEMSNRNYTFRNDPQSLVGKYVGVVLGEEEYQAKDSSVRKRLYVAQKRSGQSIRQNDFQIPELKKLAGAPVSSASSASFGLLEGDDADIPF